MMVSTKQVRIKEEPIESPRRPVNKEVPAPVVSKSSLFSSASLSLGALLPFIIAWISSGTVEACYNIWIPLPFFGYFRWDIAVLAFVGAQLPLFYFCLKGDRIAWVLLVVLVGLPLWPGQPVTYTRPPHLFLKLLHENGVNPFGKTVQIGDSGLSNEDADAFVELAWKHRANWTHATGAEPLGYFQFGKSENIDRETKTRPPFYSLALGLYPERNRLIRESYYRLHFPQLQDYIQTIIREEMLPKLRGVYSKALNSTDIMFGDDLSPGLGLPSIGIVAPNAIWNWICNVHTDRNYQDRIRKTATETNCTADPQIRAFIMPLTTPSGAGLRYWKDTEKYEDILYEMGKMYSFDAATVHAVRPLPYYEWRRSEMRMVLQAFSIQCDDGRWVLYH